MRIFVRLSIAFVVVDANIIIKASFLTSIVALTTGTSANDELGSRLTECTI